MFVKVCRVACINYVSGTVLFSFEYNFGKANNLQTFN